ncbi:MAG: ATP-binding protein [Pseudomonadota bacterium]|nr:ATP-binding protein [Pseudomonadota bacterium]
MNTPQVKPGTIAPLRNVSAMVTLAKTLLERPAHISSGFGVMSGPSGYGKTVASTYTVNRLEAIYVEVREFWTRKAFCEALLRELEREPKGTIAAMMEEISFVLGSSSGRVVIIDEADKLVDKGMIELARDIQEMTSAPVILVGEELLPKKLQRFERVHNRVLSWVLAEPSDIDDARTLASILCPQVELADDLLDKIVIKTGGRTRRIANTLHEISIRSTAEGRNSFDATTYQGPIETGEAPVRGRR